MLVRYVLLTLPVHQRSFAAYYEEHDREVRAHREQLEREWGGQAFDDLPPHIRLAWKDRFYWPPWYFNDIVGYLKIGTADEALLADLFLARRFFPPTASERFSRRDTGAEGDREIIYLGSVERRSIVPGDNASYQRACRQVIADGGEAVRLQAQGLDQAEVWVPAFDLDCIDLARADQQLRERFPGRTDPR
jgi:hypothetical protein